MTREAVREMLTVLASGLPADDAGVRRLLGRVAEHHEAEALRALLIEAGARAALEEGQRG